MNLLLNLSHKNMVHYISLYRDIFLKTDLLCCTGIREAGERQEEKEALHLNLWCDERTVLFYAAFIFSSDTNKSFFPLSLHSELLFCSVCVWAFSTCEALY